MADRFAALKKKVMGFNQFTKAACVLELDANGIVSVSYVASIQEIAAMQINLHAMLLKQTLDSMPAVAVKNQEN